MRCMQATRNDATCSVTTRRRVGAMTSRVRSPIRPVFGDRAGANTIEFAITAIVFFFIIFGVIDLARYFLTWHGLNTVASEAARAWMVNNSATYACASPTSGTAATVAASAPFLNSSSLTLCVTSNTSNGITTVVATAKYPFKFMVPPLSVANATLVTSTTLSY
jgi:Flp pilus assembly protein TadG